MRRTARPVLPALARCVLRTGELLLRRSVRLPGADVGLQLRFADGTTGRVYRETVVTGAAVDRPCVLVVGWFPGFVSKLWLAHDDREVYRGIYPWNGVEQAEVYVRCLRRVLELVCAPASIRHVVLPGAIRADVIEAGPGLGAAGKDGWWRPVATVRTAAPG